MGAFYKIQGFCLIDDVIKKVALVDDITSEEIILISRFFLICLACRFSSLNMGQSTFPREN